jgi:cyclopropane fatty-acyl-phospholipid synthase-like methyltransferase
MDRQMNQTADNDTRSLTREGAKALPPGASHYTAFVGPPKQYDFMGATQFRLLTTLGLREHHSVLDFGCGSLRAGRLLIPYLLEGRYFGLEPNKWLIDDAIDREIGQTIIDLKRPTFLHHSNFSVKTFGVSFDYILAQSIFSHAGRDVILKCLAEFRLCLKSSGLILATFVQLHQMGSTADFDGCGWVYPHCAVYKLESVMAMIEDAGLVGRALPWFHPRQTWFAMALSPDGLPATSDDVHLSGVVLRSPELAME